MAEAGLPAERIVQMTEGRPSRRRSWRSWLWRWPLRICLAGIATLVIASLKFMLGRQPWIEPLPNVRLQMARPFLEASALGPQSAYRLLLEAVEPPPAEVSSASEPSLEQGPPETVPTWQTDWYEALDKLRQYPWPANLPAESTSQGIPPSPQVESPWTRAQVEDIERLAREYGPKIALLDRALAAPDAQMPTPTDWSVLDYLAQSQTMARWLAVSAQRRSALGDSDGSLRDIERILGLGNLITRGSDLPALDVCCTCHRMAASAARTLAMQGRSPVPVLRQEAQALLAAAAATEPFGEAMRVSLTAAKETAVRLVYTCASVAPEEWNHPGGLDLDMACRRLNFLIFRLAGSTPKATTCNLEACSTYLISLADCPYSAGVQQGYDELFASLRQSLDREREGSARLRDPVGLSLAYEFFVLFSYSRSHALIARHDAELRGTALFLAIKAFEQEHGAPPETLDQLVPDYLPQVPLDPYDGQPFRYLRRNVPGLPPEAWAVYSIGGNFRDDGGTARQAGPGFRDADTVWPSQDYPPAE